MITLQFAMLGWAEVVIILAVLACLAIVLAFAGVAAIVVIRYCTKSDPAPPSDVPPLPNKQD